MIHLTKHEQAIFYAISRAEYIKGCSLSSSIIESINAKGLLNRIELNLPYSKDDDKLKCVAYSGTCYVLNSAGIRQLFEMGLTDNLSPYDLSNLLKISKHKDITKEYGALLHKSLIKIIKRGYAIIYPNKSLSTTKAGEELLDQRCRPLTVGLSVEKLLLAYFELSKARDALKGDEARSTANGQLEMLKCEIDSLRS